MSATITANAETINRPGAARGQQHKGGSRLGFSLFIVVNVLLLVRPGELYRPIQALHLYELSMIACLAIYWPRILNALTWRRLKSAPITVCVLLLLPIITWSILWSGKFDYLERFSLEYFKIALYYLILVCAVDSPARMRRFVLALALIITVVGAVALIDHLGVVRFEAIVHLADRRTGADGKDIVLDRLQGVGIFSDPNDLAQMLGVGMVLCVYGAELARGVYQKMLWAPPMLVMLAGIYLSQSRGGLLAMLGGLGILFTARFGMKKAMILAGCILPPLLLVFAGHRTNISTTDDSAQSRVQLWSDALEAARSHPIFGMGAGVLDDTAGQVAHNSFLQCYAEQGVPGGYLFFLAWFIAIWGVVRLRVKGIRILDEDLAKLTPVLAAAIVCYAVGMLSLTRNYVIPTYLMLGLATVYMGIVRTYPEKALITWRLRLLGRVFAVSILYLLAMQLFIKMFVRWS